jgi:hypothetical protein
MNEQESSPAIRAGEAFMAAFADDPQVQRSMAKAAFRLRAFAAGINAIGATQRQVMETIEIECAAFQNLLKELVGEQQQWIQAKMAPLQAAQERAFAELTAEIQQSHDQLKNNLAAHGFDPPNDLEEWDGLARLADKEPGAMTIAEIYDWAIAWAKAGSAAAQDRAGRNADSERQPIAGTTTYPQGGRRQYSPGRARRAHRLVRRQADLPGARHASEPAILAAGIAGGPRPHAGGSAARHRRHRNLP